MWFKIKGRDTRIKSKEFSEGITVQFHIAAKSEEEARKLCEDKGIVDLEYCTEDFDYPA